LGAEGIHNCCYLCNGHRSRAVLRALSPPLWFDYVRPSQTTPETAVRTAGWNPRVFYLLADAISMYAFLRTFALCFLCFVRCIVLSRTTDASTKVSTIIMAQKSGGGDLSSGAVLEAESSEENRV
jgi:hypothetical protein